MQNQYFEYGEMDSRRWWIEAGADRVGQLIAAKKPAAGNTLEKMDLSFFKSLWSKTPAAHQYQAANFFASSGLVMPHMASMLTYFKTFDWIAPELNLLNFYRYAGRARQNHFDRFFQFCLTNQSFYCSTTPAIVDSFAGPAATINGLGDWREISVYLEPYSAAMRRVKIHLSQAEQQRTNALPGLTSARSTVRALGSVMVRGAGIYRTLNDETAREEFNLSFFSGGGEEHSEEIKLLNISPAAKVVYIRLECCNDRY